MPSKIYTDNSGEELDKIADLMKKVHKKLPGMVEEGTIEAAFIAAEYLDKSTRENLNKTGRSTGALAGSWTPTFIQKGEEITAGAYSDLPYAAIHETGGTIKPTKAKALSIPITTAAFNTGSPRNWQGKLEFVPRRGNYRAGYFIANNQVQYALKYQVTLKATGYITKAAMEATPEIAELIGDSAYKAFLVIGKGR